MGGIPCAAGRGCYGRPGTGQTETKTLLLQTYDLDTCGSDREVPALQPIGEEGAGSLDLCVYVCVFSMKSDDEEETKTRENDQNKTANNQQPLLLQVDIDNVRVNYVDLCRMLLAMLRAALDPNWS